MLTPTFLTRGAMVALFLILALPLSAQNVTPSDLMNADRHDISVDAAVSIIANYRQSLPEGAVIAGTFGRASIEKLLAYSQSVAGIRYYFARLADGTPTLVLVGIDSDGADLTQGVLLEESHPCPPFCASAESELMQRSEPK